MPRLTQLDRFCQIHRIGRTNRNPIPQRTEAKPDDPGKGRGVSESGNAVATLITDEGPVEFHPDRGWCSRRRHIQRSRKRIRIGGQNRIVPADVGGLFDHPGHELDGQIETRSCKGGSIRTNVQNPPQDYVEFLTRMIPCLARSLLGYMLLPRTYHRRVCTRPASKLLRCKPLCAAPDALALSATRLRYLTQMHTCLSSSDGSFAYAK